MAALYKLTIINDHKIAIGIYQVLFAKVLAEYIDSPLKFTFRLRMNEAVSIENVNETALHTLLEKAEDFLSVLGLTLSYSLQEC